MPTIESYGRRYVQRDDLSGTSRDRYSQLLTYYILGEPATSNRRGMTKGKPVTPYGIGDIRVTELTRARVRLWWQNLPVKILQITIRFIPVIELTGLRSVMQFSRRNSDFRIWSG